LLSPDRQTESYLRFPELSVLRDSPASIWLLFGARNVSSARRRQSATAADDRLDYLDFK
jgi:hypothetical protein